MDRKRALFVLLNVGILASAVSSVFSQDHLRDKRLGELADTERAFAAATVKEGFRDGFI